MDGFEKGLVAEFLGERWSLFVAFLAQRGLDESDAEAIVEKLEADE